MDGITPFNLEKENEEGTQSGRINFLGTFDGNGYYTWKKDRDAAADCRSSLGRSAAESQRCSAFQDDY